MRLPPGRHIFFDFEASSTDASTAEPLEIAAIEVIDGVAARKLVSLLKPRHPVPKEITELTGITDSMVATAPTPESFAERLRAFLGDSPRVAHNATYDETLLTRILGARQPGPSLDSLELACLLRPDLPGSGLAFLRRTLGVPERTHHRAEADVWMLLDVVQALLAGLAERPAQLTALLTPLGDCDFGWRPTLAALAAAQSEARAETPTVTTTEPAPARPKQVEPQPVNEAEVEAFFVGSLETDPIPRAPRLAQAMPGYEPRPQQPQMALAVARALSTNKHALVEAPTGVGKSLAYLVPLALYARKNQTVVGVSTNTRGLQDQLDKQDLPVLDRALGGGLRWQVVKGRANYVCREAWREQVAALGEDSSLGERVGLAYLGAIATGPGNGEVAQVRGRMRQRYPELAFLVERVRGRECSGQKRHESCPAGQVARRAARAHLVIINHALLLTGSQLLPELEHLVIDEAHALEQRASSVLGQELDARELSRLTQRIGTGVEQRGLARALQVLATRSGAPSATEGERLAEKTRGLAAVLARWQDFAGELAHAHRDGDDDHGYLAPEVTLGALRPRERARYRELAEALEQALYALRRALDDGLRRLDRLALDTKGRARKRVLERALSEAKFALYEQLAVLEELSSEPKRREVRLLRTHVQDPARWSLRLEPLAVAEELHDKIFARYKSVTLTSATLALGDRGNYIAQHVGYPEDPARAEPLLRLSAPWDEELAAVNLLVDDLPPIKEREARAQAFAELISEVSRTLRGRTLVLFCAAARMVQTAELTRPLLSAQGLRLLEQERDGWVRDLLRQMRTDSGTVLFGLQSFWTGVDIAGPALSCVIVERVPFASQKRPVVAARMKLEGPGYAGFEHYLLPTALLDLRQGAGRLLRRGDDRGIVVLCHEGLSQKKYRDRVLAVLPGGESEEVPRAEIGAALRRACATLGIPTTD